jgi:ergothioneine biosynthesis protein EgtB
MMPVSAKPSTQSWQIAHAARHAGSAELAVLLRATRARSLALLACYQAALGDALAVPRSPQLNPPRWELGHVGWFQDYWIARNPQRALGTAYDSACVHSKPRSLINGVTDDDLYNSSLISHESRWDFALPTVDATRADLQAGLTRTLALLAQSPEDDQALYFFRLALLHEDMHCEAAVYMAQAMGIAISPDLLAKPVARPINGPATFTLPAGDWQLGSDGAGFAFDNELPAHSVAIEQREMDSQCVSWSRYLPFVEQGGYTDKRWWSAQGWDWLTAEKLTAPLYLRLQDGGWQCQRFGVWQALELDASAVHLSFFEVQAWCNWAGLSLPTEAEWECAAMTQPEFVWGDVWEWTASEFQPYPGFEIHPYRDYSAPWFDERPVLRGASLATPPSVVHPRLRNFFTPERNDIHAGFRTCR